MTPKDTETKAALDRAARSTAYCLTVASLAVQDAAAWRNPHEPEVLAEIAKAEKAISTATAFIRKMRDAYNSP